MNTSQILKFITERDIDLLLLEEIHCSLDFATWLLEKVWPNSPGPNEKYEVFHSVADPELGESDLVFIFRDTSEKRYALLIENKIDAPPQPHQGERYKERGRKGVSEGNWALFRTLILAPDRYLKSTEDTATYDSQLTYEELVIWFKARCNLRWDYKARILEKAIEQNRRGYTPKIDEQVTRFWKYYWLRASEEFPELEMKEPGGKPSKSDWIVFLPGKLPQNLKILHKLRSGVVDLQIDKAGNRTEDIRSSIRPVLGDGLDVVQTHKSAAIRAIVPKIDRFGDFDAQLGNVRTGLRAAFKLLNLSHLIKTPNHSMQSDQNY